MSIGRTDRLSETPVIFHAILDDGNVGEDRPITAYIRKKKGKYQSKIAVQIFGLQ